MGATREIDEDVERTNAANALVGTYRVEVIGRWPLLFHELKDAIRFLIDTEAFWYQLEQKTDGGKWKILVSRKESRERNDYIGEDHTGAPDKDIS